MAIASTSQFPAGDDAAASSPSGPPARRSRFRPWMMVPVVILVLGLGVGGYYALMIRNAFSTIHTITTPAAAVSGSTLGGAASITIDTSAAKTAVAQAAAGIETPTPDVSAAAVAPGTTTPAAPIETATEQPPERRPGLCPRRSSRPAPRLLKRPRQPRRPRSRRRRSSASSTAISSRAKPGGISSPARPFRATTSMMAVRRCECSRGAMPISSCSLSRVQAIG